MKIALSIAIFAPIPLAMQLSRKKGKSSKSTIDFTVCVSVSVSVASCNRWCCVIFADAHFLFLCKSIETVGKCVSVLDYVNMKSTLLRACRVSNGKPSYRAYVWCSKNDENWIKIPKILSFDRKQQPQHIHYCGTLDGLMLLMTLLLASKSNLLFCIKCAVRGSAAVIICVELRCRRLESTQKRTQW